MIAQMIALTRTVLQSAFAPRWQNSAELHGLAQEHFREWLMP